MTNRIRALVRQAREYATTRHPVSNITLSVNSDLFEQKFALLMVWEAIGVCKANTDALTSPFLSEYEKGIVEGYRRANENLRGYFGVEL